MSVSRMKDYIKGNYKGVEMYAPSKFWTLSNVEIGQISNGCGAAGAAIDYVPDTIWGLRISAACDIHDFGYHEGGTKDDKYVDDLFLLINTMQIIKAKTKWKFLKVLRLNRALKYFYMVDFYGTDAYTYNVDEDIDNGVC